MLLFENDAYRVAAAKYIVPIPILAKHAQLIKDKPIEEQNKLLEQWAEEIITTYPKREYPLERREDLLNCMKKFPVMSQVSELDVAYDPVKATMLKEIDERTKGKNEDEIMRILKQYVEIFRQCNRGIEIEID